MMPWRRLAPLLAGVAIAVAGLALGAQLQSENALPPDWESQALANARSATGDVVALTGLVVAAGATLAIWALAPRGTFRSARISNSPFGWRPSAGVRALFALFLGAYVGVNLVQTAWPYYVSLPGGSFRQAILNENLLASNQPAVPSVLIPVFAAWAGGLMLVFWGMRWLRGAPPSVPALQAVQRQHGGLLLAAAPFLGLAFWGCLRLLVALPPVPGAALYRVLLSLEALAFLGLLAAGVTKAWHLARAVHDPRLSALALDGWEGIGRAEAGLVTLILVLAALAFFLPGFPPAAPDCTPLVPSSPVACSALDPAVQYHSDLDDFSGLLQTGTFGTQLLSVHVALLLGVLVPLASIAVVHRRGLRALEASGPEPIATRFSPMLLCTGLGLSFALGGAATWLASGALLAWVAATLPLALVAARSAGRGKEAQAMLMAAYAAWSVGNSLSAQYNGLTLGLVQFTTSPSLLALWRLLGAVLAGWGLARFARASAPAARASMAIPMAAAALVAILLVALLELPLDIWTDSFTSEGQTHNASVFVGTAVSRMSASAASAIHLLCLAASLGAALLVSRLVGPDPAAPRALAAAVLEAPPSPRA